MKTISFVLVIAFFTGTPAGAADKRRATPLELKMLPQGAHGHRAHRLGDRLIVFGGYGLDAIEFDPATREWSKFPPMRVRKVFFGSVMVEGQIYAIGGDGKRSGEPGVIERFDATKNRWEVVLRSDKLPKSHLTAAAVGENIYIVGGFPQTEAIAQVFDVRSGELAAMEPMPGAKPGDHFHYLATLDGNLHVLGGMRFADGDSGPMNEHWMWDGKTWHKRAALPKASMSKLGAHGVLRGKLYVFSRVDGLHHVYDPDTDGWSDRPAPIPAALSMPAVVPDTDFLHVLGGIDPTNRTPPNAVRTYDVETNRWRTSD